MIELKYVVIALATTLLVCVLGIIALAMTAHAIPDVLQNIAVGALTALAGVLVPTSATVARQRRDTGA